MKKKSKSVFKFFTYHLLLTRVFANKSSVFFTYRSTKTYIELSVSVLPQSRQLSLPFNHLTCQRVQSAANSYKSWHGCIVARANHAGVWRVDWNTLRQWNMVWLLGLKWMGAFAFWLIILSSMQILRLEHNIMVAAYLSARQVSHTMNICA